MGCSIAARKRQNGILLTLTQNVRMSKLTWNSSNHLPKQIQSIKTDQKAAKQFLGLDLTFPIKLNISRYFLAKEEYIKKDHREPWLA